jgi:hypothetical protein
MMRILALLSLFCISFFAANLTSITSTQENDQVILMMTFDKPFDGVIDQNNTAKGLLLTMSELNVEQRKDIAFENSFLTKAVLAKIAPKTAVLYLETANTLNINASKSADAQKMTITISKQIAPAAPQEASAGAPKTALQETAGEGVPDLSWRYITATLFMLALLVGLMIVKKKFQNSGPKTISDLLSKGGASNDIKIISQKFIDNTNRVMLIEYADVKYLLLVGSSSMVIDKFYDNVSDITDTDFQKALAYAQVASAQSQPHQPKTFNDFDDYRKKAEGEL